MRLPCVRKTQQAGEDKVARDSGAAAAGGRRNKPETRPYVREIIRQKRLAAVEGRMTKQEKKATKAKKKPQCAPLRGPNSHNTMRWVAG